MSDMYNSVTGAKDAMIGAVMGGVEMTRAAVNERITSVSQMVSSGVNMALSHSESWVDHYLPLSEKELGEHRESDRPPNPNLNSSVRSEILADTNIFITFSITGVVERAFLFY